MRLLITCRDREGLMRTYVPAVRLGGWEGPIEILAAGGPLPTWEGAAGLLLSGGADIHPRHWDPDEPLHPAADADEERDALEMLLIMGAWERHLPIFGICRGEQTLNVALGGSLIQDIPSHYACSAEIHRHGDNKEPDLHHFVRAAPGSRLEEAMGQAKAHVNSRHHQAVGSPAPPLKAVAWHDETQLNGEPLIEAVEARDPSRWALGVQWHPENLVALEGDGGRAARELFRAFASALNAASAGQQ